MKDTKTKTVPPFSVRPETHKMFYLKKCHLVLYYAVYVLTVTGVAMSNSSKMNSGSLAAATSISNSVKPCRSRVLTGIPSNVSKKSFHISGHNGDSIIQSICLSHGWIALDDVNSDQFFFKWTELRKFIDYTKFREGNNGTLVTMVTKLVCTI